MGRIYIKEIEAKILDKIKTLEEIKTKLRELEIKISIKRFWNEVDEQKTLKK